jgi:metallo-beta-lactamase class B
MRQRIIALFISAAAFASAQNMPNHPQITVDGVNWTPLSIVSGNMGTPAEQEAQFPPFKVIGNVYYVGTKTLSSFLIHTSAGNFLIDSTYERNVKTIQKSVEQLGFKFSDTKIVLGNHAHGDHMEGDAMVKELTGAKVMVLAEDEPMLRAMKANGKEHPIDKVLHDGEAVTLGDTTLVAHFSGGHSPGATTWTVTQQEGGKSYNVVFFTSTRSPGKISPEVAAQFNRTFPAMRALPCDVPLGDHGREFHLVEKYEKMKAGGPNPFIDKAGCKWELDLEEAMFHAIMAEQISAEKHQ